MVHHGTREAPARAVALGDGAWQLRLEAPLVAVAGDRVVLRSIAPPDTLGGGVVLDAHPRRHAELEAPPAEPAPAPVPEPVPPVPPPLPASALATEERLRSLQPPADAELPAADLAALRAHGRAVRVSAAQHFHADVLEDVRRRVVALLEAEGEITLARVRDELGSSRRYVQALLEHLDAERVTLRRGDVRVLRRRPR
jgi:selenocysteine-specific elongation factor